MKAMDHLKLNLIWIDLEMTGLNPEQDRIIEIATVVTDANLNNLVEGPNLVIHQSDALLDQMDEWNTSHHGGSGLTDLVRASRQTEKSVEKVTLEFLVKNGAEGSSPMCGNSVCQDRQFLRKYMPDLHDFFHYRNIDVSTLKELNLRWNPKANQFSKQGSHRALDDIKESIAELKHYRSNFLICDHKKE